MKSVLKIIIDISCLCLVGVPILLFKLLGQPYKRGFFVDDESIQYPYKTSTITSLILYTVALGLPALVISLVEAVLIKTKSQISINNDTIRFHPFVIWLYSTYLNWLFFYFGACIEHLTTDIAKYSIGRLRPHFMDVCKPVWSPVDTIKYIEDFNCTGTDQRLLRESRLSFPSGHASLSTFAMLYMIFYIQVKVHWKFCKLVKPVCQMIFFLMAFYTCLSRVSDYKHHWSDVLAGACIGAVTAVIDALYVSDLSDLYKMRKIDRQSDIHPVQNYSAFEESNAL